MRVLAADKLRAGIQRAIKTRVCRHSETLVRVSPTSGTSGKDTSGQTGVKSMSVQTVGRDMTALPQPEGLANSVGIRHQL